MYLFKNENGQVESYGLIAGSKPKEQYFRKNIEERDNALKSRDIKGNNPGSRTLGAFHERSRKDIREVGKIDDILGT